MSRKYTLNLIKAAFIFVVLASLSCNLLNRIQEQKPTPEITQETKPTTQESQALETPTSIAPEVTNTPKPQRIFDPNLIFAVFNEPASNIQTSASQAAVPPALEDVFNPFLLAPSQKELLSKNGFVVSQGTEKEFFMLYEKARYSNIPIFVTSDSLLHSYHLMFDKVLRTSETEQFIPKLRSLNASLLGRSQEIYQELQGSSWEDAARRLVAFLGVGSTLLDRNVEAPDYAKDLVQAELGLIDSAAGILPSPLFPYYTFGEDYTQYIPRGHYTKSEELKAYFKSMMWYGRMTFRLETKNLEAGRAETRTALLLVYALYTSQVDGNPALKSWLDLYNPTVFFVGRSDDLNVLQYKEVMDRLYGKDAPLSAIADDGKLDLFIQEANQLPPPLILGMVIYDTDNEEQETKGLRLMGQRFVPDAYIFRQLIYRNVGTQTNRRGLPKGLDLMAAMGSERAYQILDELGETRYENYPAQMEKVRSWLSGLTVNEWTETLYNSWIYSFYPLIETPSMAHPFFMRSTAWLDKQLNTSLGSWAELKHDTILYAKQVYAEMGGGPPPPEPVPPRGYVEPVPVFYARLAALTAMTYDGLDRRGLLNDMDRDSLKRLEQLALELKTMAEKELRGEPLSEEEYERIRFYGGELEHFVMASADTDAQDPFAPKYMDEEPRAAVVADVATDPDPADQPGPVVLEVGVGNINDIYVIVPIANADGTIFWEIAKGGVFSYYEFPWPADDRLTDEKWRTMLDEGNAPALPVWTKSFVVSEGENEELRRAIFEFQQSVTDLFWYSYPDVVQYQPALEVFLPELNQQIQAQQYRAHQMVNFKVLSYDLQSESLAVVVVSETWQDKLYSGDVYSHYEDIPFIAERGPYTITVTYTIEYQGDSIKSWKVTSLSSDTPIPAWNYR